MSGAEFVESLVGVGAARVRDLFERARKNAPAIVFIDELDAAGRRRGAGIGQGNDEREQTLNQLLVEMDGFGAEAGIVVMGATNRPDILDPALLRPGRFDRQVTIDVPDVHGRAEILELHAQGMPLAPDASLHEIAKLTPGFTGAELANVINEAALLTVRGGEPRITQKMLEEAIDRVVAGPAKKSHVLTQAERWVIAVHESAHAVVTRSIGQTVSAQKLSIVARGRTLGTAAHMLTDRDQVVEQEPDLRRQLVAIVSGAAGERIEYGCLSTGVHDDLHAATQLARRMVTSFGMSDALGPVTIGERDGEVFLGASLQDLGSVGPVHARPDRPGGGAPGRRGDGAGRRRAGAQLAGGRGDRGGAARARDAVRRRAGRGALDRAADVAERMGRRQHPAQGASSAKRLRPVAIRRIAIAAAATGTYLAASGAALLGLLGLVGPAVTTAHAVEPAWRLEQPLPPSGGSFATPLGRPGDLQFISPSRGLLAVEGTASVPRGLYTYDGADWHQLATVCGGSGDTARIAIAGPREFWTVTQPSRPRDGNGTSLCHFKDGNVIASYSTPEQDADSYRTMHAAACRGPNDCWFGGIGSEDQAGERRGAFHLHWDGISLETVYAPQGRGVTDLEVHQGTFFESVVVGRRPFDNVSPVDLFEAEPDGPRLIHRIVDRRFVNDPFMPAGGPNASELLALDGDGTRLWAGGGGAASGPSASVGGGRATAAGGAARGGRVAGGGSPTTAFGSTDRITDIAAVPGSDQAWAAVEPFGDGGQPAARARWRASGPTGPSPRERLPATAPARGAAAKIAFTSPAEGWMVTSRLGVPLHGWRPAPRDTDPAFAEPITFRPNEAAEQFIPDAPPIDDSELFKPPPVEIGQQAPPSRVRAAGAAAAAGQQQASRTHPCDAASTSPAAHACR